MLEIDAWQLDENELNDLLSGDRLARVSRVLGQSHALMLALKRFRYAYADIRFFLQYSADKLIVALCAFVEWRP